MAEYLIRTDAQVQPTLAKLKPGDAMVFAGGTYAPIRIAVRRWPSPGVVLRAAPGEDVTLGGVIFDGSAGITIQGLRIVNDAIGVMVGGTSPERIFVINLEIHGDPAGDLHTKNGTGVAFRLARFCGVRGCDIHHTGAGISHQGCDSLDILENRIHDFRFDGIRGGSSNLRIEGNEIRDMFPAPADHPDGIQLWTAGLTGAQHNIVVRRNRLLRGRGSPFQGIFVGNEAQFPWEGLVIEENLVVSDHHHGISVYVANAPVIRGNYVGAHSNGLGPSWIKADGCVAPEISDNVMVGPVLLNGSGGRPNSIAARESRNSKVSLLRKDDDSKPEAWWRSLAPRPITPSKWSAATPPPSAALALAAAGLALAVPGTRRGVLALLAAQAGDALL